MAKAGNEFCILCRRRDGKVWAVSETISMAREVQPDNVAIFDTYEEAQEIADVIPLDKHFSGYQIVELLI